MEKLLIRGGKKLEGIINISYSKNAFLSILAGCILTEKKVILHHCPKYLDVINMIRILESLGGKITPKTNTGELEDDCDIEVDCSNINSNSIPHDLTCVIRSSIFSLGSILGRLKKAKVAYPGGCDIGARPIDLHIKVLRALNVKVYDRYGFINCDGEHMRGGVVSLDFPSVGATENIILAATLTKGTTEIINAAKEPEIVDLSNFLNTLGAKIYGAGTSNIIIEGVKKLKGGEYTPIPDRIIAGTYLIAGLITNSDLEIRNFRAEHNAALLEKITNSSCKIKIENGILYLKSEGKLRSIPKIETSPYPGFPTDLQAQILALQTVSSGTSIIVENVFETRFKHVPELVKMGADITVKDRTAVISGVEKLYGASVNATDLRGGVGLVLAGLVAEGNTIVNHIEQIDRGYFKLEEQLKSLGAEIERIKD